MKDLAAFRENALGMSRPASRNPAFSVSPDGMRASRLIPGTDLYANLHASGEAISRRARKLVLRAMGSEEGFKVELSSEMESGA